MKEAAKGIRIVAHPLVEGLRTPKLKLSKNVTVSDQFRSEFDAWLVEQFGTHQVAIIMPNQNLAYLAPSQFAALRNFT